MNIAICDDEKEWQQALLKCLDEYKNKRHIDISASLFSDGGTLCRTSTEKYDIIFMDCRMKTVGGVEAAKRIHMSDPAAVIIFVSAYPQNVPEAFEVKAFRFISKPIDKTKLFKAVDDFFSRNQRDKLLIFKAAGETVRIRTSEIICAEARKNHTVIHTPSGDREVLAGLKEVEKILPKNRFFRCHHAYITSFLHISSQNGTEIRYCDGSSAYISRAALTDFKKAFHEYLIECNIKGT